MGKNKNPRFVRTGGLLCSVQGRTANREGGCSIQFDTDFEALAEGNGDIQAYPQWYGFGHDAEYWSDVGALEAEAWAQFDRTYYNNDPDVQEIFEGIFPNLSTHAMMALKGLI